MPMSETFPSGSSPSPIGGAQAGDVTSTLAELERKLRELERELTSIGRRRVQPAGDTIETEQAAAPPRHDLGRLVDEQVEPPAATAFTAARPPSAPPPTSDGERAVPTEAQLASLAELRRFRERLERFAKELLNDYDAVLSRAMAGVAGRVPADAPADSAFGGAPEPPSPPPPPPSPEDALFEGRVELGVGPFDGISSLSAFEQRLASLPYVIDVAVRRFETAHAVVDLRLATPVALMRELRDALDTDFSVRQVGPGRIQLSFNDA
jgi:hypothetical protein